MIVTNKDSFSVRLMQKEKNALTAPKDTYYAEYRICLALAGEANWEIEDRTYRIQPGDIVFLNIGQRRQFTAFGEEGFQLCIFTLNRSAFSELHYFTFFLDRVKRQQNLFKNSPLSPILLEAFEEWNENRPHYRELISAKLTEFFIKAEREAGYSAPLDKNGLDLLLQMDGIDKDIEAGLRLREIAQKAGLSESAFSRRFSAVNGVSFKQYSIEKKLQRAILLLKTTDLKMIDIAAESGFESISGFYGAFKKKTGTTPNQFLRE